MRILMVTRGVVPIGLGAGGAELAAYELARELAHAGHEIVLVSDVAGGDLSRLAVPGLSFATLDSRALRTVKRLRGGFFRWIVEHLIGNVGAARAARRLLASGEHFDLVHLNGALATVLVARRAHVPVVFTEQDATPWLCRYRHWWERAIRKVIYRLVNVRAIERADHVVTVFASLHDELVHRFGIDREKLTTISNGTDVDVFNPHRPGVSLVRDVHHVARYVLFVGRLSPRKAPDLLVRALADTPDVVAVFAGDGPMRARLEQLAREQGVADRALFLGNVPQNELARVYADADVTVLPSVSEGLPLSIVESMACGTPVIATRVAGIEGLIEDWENGFLVKAGDLGQLEMAIRFLWGDASLRERMGRNARERAIGEFVWPLLAQQYLDLYARLGPAHTVRRAHAAASPPA